MAGNGGAGGGRSVASKVGSVLDAFLPASRQLSLTELAERSGLPSTTAYRLAAELVAWGALEKVPGGGYRVAMRLWEIGSLATRASTLQDIARPFMQDLFEATQENVHLAVLDGSEALYIEKVTGRQASTIRTRQGGRLPLHATGVGKVLLAYSGKEFVQEVLAGELRRYTAHTIVTPSLLLRAFTEIRRNGVAFAREELSLGSVSVAAALLDGNGEIVAAMSVVSRASGADLARLAPAVRTAAIGASRALTRYSPEYGQTGALPVQFA